MNWLKSACIAFLILSIVGCNRLSLVGAGSTRSIHGFYLLNEGNDECSLDFYDYATGIYYKDIFPERNPEGMSGIGNAGNDMVVYGTRLYIAASGSNVVEVIDIRTGWHIDQIPIKNCRSFACKDDYVYVSSYNCPVELDPDAPLGYVAKIDTNSVDVRESCAVGYQPEEMAIVGEYLYVANSGSCRVPNYDNTVSVVDLHIFREVQKIEVAPNLHRMEADSYGKIWVSSLGDHYDIPSMVSAIRTDDNSIDDVLDQLHCSDMALCGDSLYVVSNVFNYFTQSREINYSIVDVRTHEVVTDNFITDGTDQEIQNPYGITVCPKTRDILVTDARDGVTPGKVYCFSKEGKLKWSTYTGGEKPSRIAFSWSPLL